MEERLKIIREKIEGPREVEDFIVHGALRKIVRLRLYRKNPD